MYSRRCKLFLGYIFIGFTFSSSAKSTTLPDTFPFVLQKDVVCASGYAADDESTLTVEKQCVLFDLTGLEASAFQAGVAIGEMGNSKEIRPFWPLVDMSVSI
ncbi:MAG: hypothetical protein EOP07_24085 [Proteobacteria bacterium]|nr:MAG: hypothetical protein EOP07_24085 [Pseudomonadota bacterium]